MLNEGSGNSCAQYREVCLMCVLVCFNVKSAVEAYSKPPVHLFG